jgi:hypothetical protein
MHKENHVDVQEFVFRDLHYCLENGVLGVLVQRHVEEEAFSIVVANVLTRIRVV